MGFHIDGDFDDLEQENKQQEDYQELKQKLIDCQINLKESKNVIKQLEEALKQQSMNSLDELEILAGNNNSIDEIDLFNISVNKTFIIT